MIILYVDSSEDDRFFFGRALQKVSAAQWHGVTTIHDAKCYLKGEGRYADRARYPSPDLVIVDSKLPDGTGGELLSWAQSRPELASLPFCVFTELPDNARKELGQKPSPAMCALQKPSELGHWPTTLRQMLQRHADSTREHPS